MALFLGYCTTKGRKYLEALLDTRLETIVSAEGMVLEQINEKTGVRLRLSYLSH